MALPTYPPIFWLTAALAVILLGVAKAGFGGGAGVIGTPLMSLVIPVADAAALLLVLLIIVDLLTVPHYRHSFHRASLKWLFGGALLGIGLGTLSFSILSENDRVLRMIVGIIALLYVLYRTSGFGEGRNIEQSRWYRPGGILAGVLSGFASTLAHAGGPPASIYLLPQNLPKNTYVGTLAIFFMVVNIVKLVPYAYLGLLRVGNITTILILSPLCLVGARLGIYLNQRFEPLWFNRTVYILLFLTGIQLIIGQSLIKLFFR